MNEEIPTNQSEEVSMVPEMIFFGGEEISIKEDVVPVVEDNELHTEELNFVFQPIQDEIVSDKKYFFINPVTDQFMTFWKDFINEDFILVDEEIYEQILEKYESGKFVFSNSNPDDPLELVERRVTLEELKERFLTLVQTMMDTKARSYGYDNINSAVSYAEEPSVITYQQEGKAFRSWRSLVWLKCNTLLAEVVAGEREIPTEQELLDSLPSLVI